MTTEHIARERERLATEEQQMATQLNEAKQNHSCLLREEEILAGQCRESQQAVQLLQQDLVDIGQREQHCINTQSKAEAQTRTAMNGLPPTYAMCFGEPVEEPVAIEHFFRVSFPTEEDMQEFRQRLRGVEKLAERGNCIKKALERQRDLLSRRSLLQEELAPLVICYPPERIQELRQRHRNLQTAQRALNQAQADLTAQLKQQKQGFQKSEDQQRSVEAQLTGLERQLAVAETQVHNLDGQLSEKQAVLPLEWQAQSTDITNGRLAEQLLELLTTARRNRQHLEVLREQLLQECEAIPVGAKRPTTELDQAEDQARAQYQLFDGRESQARTSKVHLEMQQQRRDELATQQKQAARNSVLYKELAKLLGPHGLQHYLLQKAETGIVYYANEELDRISAGALSLKLQASEKAKAFELLACNREISATHWMPVRSLSGSQQFRVSVSLALGIGKYTSQDNQRMESVMIDEGFGSLDTQGRMDMVQVLKELKDTLKCIIVISHQEEIFKEFDNKYIIELVDGRSCVMLD